MSPPPRESSRGRLHPRPRFSRGGLANLMCNAPGYARFMRHAERRSLLLRYTLAVGLVALVAVLHVFLDPLIGDPSEFALFYLAVAMSAFLGGLGPGLVAT